MSNIKRSAVFKLVCVSAISGILLTGCTEDGTSNNSNPTVEYKENVAGDNNLAKYTSADWLYQNYLGDYGLPDVLKDEMMTVLMMLANGFALQHSRGEDVEASISEMHTAMQMMYHSGQLGSSVQSMFADYEAGFYDTVEEEIIPESYIKELVLSEEAKKNIAEAERLDKIFNREQEQLVIDYNLPYALPDSAIKYITYSQAQRFKRRGGGKNNRNKKPEKPKQHKGIDKWNWKTADIVWTNALKGIGHVGIVSVEGRNNAKVVVDANPANPGELVKDHREGLDNWANTGGWSRIEGWRYRAWAWFVGGWFSEDCAWYLYYRNSTNFWNRSDELLESYRRSWAMNDAYNRAGTPYSIWGGKSRDTDTYCSKLVWNAYDSVGLNIDRNGGRDVWPNDIRRHRLTAKFNTLKI